MSFNRNENYDKWKLEIHEKQAQDLIQLLEKFLDFKRWGFQKSYVFLNSEFPPFIIYDSEWCRVTFALQGGETHRENEMFVYYGRLHAPPKEAFMIWNEKKCRCWHQVYEALDFLDGLSPQESIRRWRENKLWPHVVERFRQSELGKTLSPDGYPSPEFMTRMHAEIWEYYGRSLFEIFDLRRPNLWEEYSHFIKEYFRIKGKDPNIIPPVDDIC